MCHNQGKQHLKDCLWKFFWINEQLHTYPSLNPTLTLVCYQLTVIVLGEG